MPGRYLKVARRPSTSRTGADLVQPTFIWAPLDEEVHRSAPGRRFAGNGWRSFDARLYLKRSVNFHFVYICSGTVLLMDLSTRVHLLNEKNGPKKGDLEGTEAFGCESPLVSPNVEPGGGDVAFGSDEDDAT